MRTAGRVPSSAAPAVPATAPAGANAPHRACGTSAAGWSGTRAPRLGSPLIEIKKGKIIAETARRLNTAAMASEQLPVCNRRDHYPRLQSLLEHVFCTWHFRGTAAERGLQHVHNGLPPAPGASGRLNGRRRSPKNGRCEEPLASNAAARAQQLELFD